MIFKQKFIQSIFLKTNCCTHQHFIDFCGSAKHFFGQEILWFAFHKWKILLNSECTDINNDLFKIKKFSFFFFYIWKHGLKLLFFLHIIIVFILNSFNMNANIILSKIVQLGCIWWKTLDLFSSLNQPYSINKIRISVYMHVKINAALFLWTQ